MHLCHLHLAAYLGADCSLGCKEGPCGPGRADPGGCNECLLQVTLKCFQLWGRQRAPVPLSTQPVSGQFIYPEFTTLQARVACFLPGLTFLHHDLLLSPACAKPSPHIQRRSQALGCDLGSDHPLSPHSLSRNTAAISPSLRDHWSVKRASSFQFAHCFLCCTEAFQFDGSYHFALFLCFIVSLMIFISFALIDT